MTQDPYRNPNPPPEDPMTGPPGAPEQADDLQFDRAESATPPSPAAVAGFQAAPPGAATACAVCNRPIADYYFEAGGKVLCPSCQQMIAASMTGGSGFGRAFKAIVFGLGVAVAVALAWWAVTHFLFKHTVYGIGALVVGLAIGRAVKKGSDNRGGIGYQLLAILLTYFAIGATVTASELTRPGSTIGQSLSPVAFAIVAVMVWAVSPVLTAFESPIMGFLFVLAFWEAWKINKHRPVTFNGPYRAAPPGGMPQMDAQAYAQGYAGAPAPAYPGAYPAPGAPAYAPPAGSAYAPAPPPPAGPGAWPPPPPGGA